jgi:ABC-type oligopeptide transport system ATPase subunit
MTPIITLFGKSGSGKSTVGRFLIEAYGGECLAFADPMKEICKEIFDFTHDQLYGDSETRNTEVVINKNHFYNKTISGRSKFHLLFNKEQKLESSD